MLVLRPARCRVLVRDADAHAVVSRRSRGVPRVDAKGEAGQGADVKPIDHTKLVELATRVRLLRQAEKDAALVSRQARDRREAAETELNALINGWPE
jgi:pyridoxal biosynthesis lyase PdxS